MIWQSLILATLSLFLTTAGFAQAFDPDVFIPQIGIDIDTMVSRSPYFGYELIKAPPPNPDQHIAITEYTANNSFHTVLSSDGESFNVKQLKVRKQYPFDLSQGTLGHFHSPKVKDFLWKSSAQPWINMIYWADDNGDFDINRRTVVAASFNGDDSLTFGFGHWIGPLYTANLSSDTVEDIIFFGETNWKSSDTATFHFLHFAGGEALYKPGDTVFETASYELGGISKNSNTSYQERLGSKGKFSGGGREDFISSDWYGNMFFYKNVSPFNLNNFGNALCFDTLFSIWDNPTLTEGSYSYKRKRFSMRALPKLAGDSSVDFMPNLNVNENDDTVYVFRGGPHFGLSRLTLDSAEIVIRPPGFYNSTFKDFNISPFFSDCGDMTGTGNPVAKRNMALGHGSGYDLYYVLGKAIDDKADIVYSQALYPTNYSIQVDADGDKFQDIVFQAFSQYNGSDPTKGGLWVLHGTNKIPVKLNPKYSAENETSRAFDDENLNFFPNPAGIQTQLDLKDFDVGRYKVVLRDILGRNIKEFELDHLGDYGSMRILVGDIPNGVYYLSSSSSDKNRKGRIIIQH